MSHRSNNITFNTEIFPNIHISSQNLKNSRALFLINPTFSVNIINENHLKSSTIIKRSNINLYLGGINISGTVEILIAQKLIKFYTFVNNCQPEIAGILGLNFLQSEPSEFHF